MLHLYEVPFFIIQRTDNKMMNYYLKSLRRYSLTIDQWFVIRALDTKGQAITQKELAQFMDKDQTTLVRIIKSMEKKGIVKREVNKKDKRSQFLSLTHKGLEIKESLAPIVEKMNRELMEGISCEEVEQLKYILNKFYTNAIKHSDK